eukprot:TRINITY_DN72547_c0_g1_i1.p1 TRINITY_DN72547_c0_g1~~TRINITY_DN72547_c0_g1_i1.p1  ORF type:complete len:638 (+),score=87.24 TRINITY_DN72547_c0_g1_i1:217-2130(+)
MKGSRRAAADFAVLDRTQEITQLGRKRLWKDALKVFHSLRSDDLRPTSVTCNALLRAVEQGKQWSAALLALEHTNSHGLSSGAATDVTVGLNAACRACLGAETWRSAELVLHSMCEVSAKADIVTYDSKVRLGSLSTWSAVLQTLQVMQNLAMQPDAPLCRLAADACCLKGCWQEALQVVSDTSFSPGGLNGGSASAIARGMAKQPNLWHHVLLLLSQAREGNEEPSSATYVATAHMCTSSWQWMAALACMDESIQRLGCEVRLATSSTFLGSVLRAPHQMSTTLQERIMDAPSSGTNDWRIAAAWLKRSLLTGLRADIAYVSSAADCLVRGDAWNAATSLLHATSTRELKLDKLAEHSRVQAFARGRQWRDCSTRLRQLQQQPELCDVGIVAAAADACQKAMQWEEASYQLDTIAGRGLRSNVVPQTVALRCAELASAWSQVLEMVTELGRTGLQKDVVPLNCLATSGERCSRWALAVGALRHIDVDGLRRDLASHNALSGLVQPWEIAISSLYDCRVRGLQGPDIVGCSAAVASTGKAGQWQWSVNLLWAMRQHLGLVPHTEAYGAAVSACSSASQWQVLEVLLREMWTEVLEPDWTIRSTLLMQRENRRGARLGGEDVALLEEGQGEQASSMKN